MKVSKLIYLEYIASILIGIGLLAPVQECFSHSICNQFSKIVDVNQLSQFNVLMLFFVLIGTQLSHIDCRCPVSLFRLSGYPPKYIAIM